jgi:hypothetical protein
VQYTATLPKPGDLIGRKYRIVASIGAGGMGVVFEAVHVDTDGPVALKWLSPELSSSPEAVERFKIEARATGRIHHPNVVAIHDLGEHEGSLYLVMELLKGSALRKRMERGPMSVVDACQVLFPVMRGVAAAHAVKVLHRDLKPDNIFLAESPDGLDAVPKVLDFGIAKLCSDSERTSPVSAKTTMMGTYQYMPFEQLHGKKDLDDRVDVYALGTVLYSMLAGRLPYEADNPVDLALQMLQAEPQPVTAYQPGIPAGVAQVVTKALARDRADRFASIDQFALALEPFAQGLRYKGSQAGGRPSQAALGAPAAAQTATPLPTPFVVDAAASVTTARSGPAVRPRKPSRMPVWLGGAASVAVVAGALFWLRDKEPSKPPAPPAAPHVRDHVAAQAPVPASSLPVGHAEAGATHVEEWASPVVQAVDVLDQAPPATPARELPTLAVPSNAGKPSAGARHDKPHNAERAAGARPPAGAPKPSASPAAEAQTPAAPSVRRGAFQPSTQELDMTELPAPSWAKQPSGKH